MSEWNATLYDEKHDFATDSEPMPEKMQGEIIEKVEELTKDALWNGSEWVADYRSLSIIRWYLIYRSLFLSAGDTCSSRCFGPQYCCRK